MEGVREGFGGRRMDNFMDKLAHRFNAQEIIKANSQAEAEEMSKLREQMKAYDECLEEMRRLSLKNIETAEQIRGMAEQVDQLTKRALASIEEKEGKDCGQAGQIEIVREEIRAAQEEAKRSQEEIKQAQEDARQVQEEIRQAQEAGKQAQEEARQVQEEIKTVQENIRTALLEVRDTLAQGDILAAEAREKLTSANDGLEDFMHRESVKVYRNVQAVVAEELKGQTKELCEKIEQSSKGHKGILILVIVTLLASLGNLGIALAGILGFL